MHIDDLFGTENLAAETGDTVLSEFYDRQDLDFDKAAREVTCGVCRHCLHMDHVGRADVIANPAASALFEVDVFDHSAPHNSAVMCVGKSIKQ